MLAMLGMVDAFRFSMDNLGTRGLVGMAKGLGKGGYAPGGAA